jgi:hypothetical protein
LRKSRRDLSLEDELCLLRLRSRCDALNMAYCALMEEEWGHSAGHCKDEVLYVVKEIMEEQDGAFARAKREVGLVG